VLKDNAKQPNRKDIPSSGLSVLDILYSAIGLLERYKHRMKSGHKPLHRSNSECENVEVLSEVIALRKRPRRRLIMVKPQIQSLKHAFFVISIAQGLVTKFF